MSRAIRALACPLRARWPVDLSQLILDQLDHGVGDQTVPLSGAVLIDQRSARGAMTHPAHQFPKAGARSGRDVVAAVPQVMDMNARQPGRFCGLPLGVAEVGPPDLAALRADEDQAVMTGRSELAEVCLDLGQQERWQGHYALARH